MAIHKTIPTTSQAHFIDTLAYLVNQWLKVWGRQSGKTTARKLLCERIMADDE